MRRGRRGRSIRRDWLANSFCWGKVLNATTPSLGFYEICGIQPVAVQDPVSVGAFEIRQIKGHVRLSVGVSRAAGTYKAYAGLYKAKWDVATGAFGSQDPSLGSQAAQDDWIWIEGFTATLPGGGIASPLNIPNFNPVNWRGRMTIHTGEALMIALSVPGSATQGIDFGVDLRVAIDREY